MTLVHPFEGLRPAPGWAADIAAPPYDVVTVNDVRETVARKPHSFLRVSRAEALLPEVQTPYSDQVYAAAARYFAELTSSGKLVRDPRAVYYVYRMTTEDRTQTGIVASVSGSAYAENRVRRHELTRPDKEDDRVRQIEAVNAITGLVMIVGPSGQFPYSLLSQAVVREPVAIAPDVNGARHELWAVFDPDEITAISEAVNSMGALYMADGHHRSAAACRVIQARRAAGKRGSPAQEGFPGVIFPSNQVCILGYHRLVRDLRGWTPERLQAALEKDFVIHPAGTVVRPVSAGTFGMCLHGRWFHLELKKPASGNDPVEALSVSCLTRLVLEPLLQVGDPRTDPRIDFVGGEDGPETVAARVASGEMEVGFTLSPVTIGELMDVADAGRILPPKTTWFEPKLADGLISLPLD